MAFLAVLLLSFLWIEFPSTWTSVGDAVFQDSQLGLSSYCQFTLRGNCSNQVVIIGIGMPSWAWIPLLALSCLAEVDQPWSRLWYAGRWGGPLACHGQPWQVGALAASSVLVVTSPSSSCSSLLESSMEKISVDRRGGCWVQCGVAEMVQVVQP